MTDFLVRVNEFINPKCQKDALKRQLNFMTYELKTAALSYEDKLERLKKSIWFMFEHKEIKAHSMERVRDVSDVLIESVVNKKRGSAVTVSILFKQMCEEVDVKLDIVSTKSLSLLKFVDKGKAFFVDVVDKKILTAEEILSKINAQIARDRKLGVDAFERKSIEEVFVLYLRVLKVYLKNQPFYRQAKFDLSRFFQFGSGKDS